MAIRRAQASVLSGINSAANGWVDSYYPRVSAGYIPTEFSLDSPYLTTQSWSRPSNVHFIDILLVGGGGSSSQTVTGGDGGAGTCARRGGGGGGGAVVQVNRFYVGDYDTWYIVIGGNSNISSWNQNNCNDNSWGRCGNPTIFSPFSTSINAQSLSGADGSNLRRTLIAPGGGGGGHPCGSPGPYSLVSSGGSGSNHTGTYMGIPNTANTGKVPWQGYGGRGGAASTQCLPGGGGAGAGGSASGSTGGSGKSAMSPFSGSYGGGGAGGGGTSGGSGGGAPGVAGTNGTGGGGGASSTSFANGLTGGTGRVEIRRWFSS